MAVTFLPVATTQAARARDSSFVMSGSTRTASRSPWMSVDAVGDHISRSSPGGKSSDATSFEGATYTEYSRFAIATPLVWLIDSRVRA